MSWQTASVLGALACVAFVAGIRNLVNVMRAAWARHRSAMAVLGVLTAALATVAFGNPEVWPLFVVGYPSLASIVLEAWVQLYARRDRLPRGDLLRRESCLAGLRTLGHQVRTRATLQRA